MERDAGVIEVLNELVARRPRWGFWKLHDRLRLDGHGINHKRLHRVYCAMKLNLPRRTKRRLPLRLRQPLSAPSRLNEIWALDFMADTLYGRRAFRTLNVIDEGNRQVLRGCNLDPEPASDPGYGAANRAAWHAPSDPPG
jgi:putative transposase